MRVAVADAMRRSWTRPLATVGLPVALDALLAHRKTCEPKPGPALYALRALAVALAENSAVAGRLVGCNIVHPSSIDVGFAVEAEDGVLVPVLRSADKKPLKDLDRALQRTRGAGAPAKAARRRHGRLHRHGDQLRHFRPDLGHADSACRSRRWCWAWARAVGCRIGTRQKASSCR